MRLFNEWYLQAWGELNEKMNFFLNHIYYEYNKFTLLYYFA